MSPRQLMQWTSPMDDFLKEKMGWLPARMALAIMAFFGFINLYMVRINLSVAIVAMVKRNTSGSGGGFTSACSVLQPETSIVLNNSLTQETPYITGEGINNTSILNPLIIEEEEEGEMYWDETTQGIVLGSFFYGYTLTQIIGGRVAELYGTCMVYGICILAGGICALLSPVVAKYHYWAFISLRTVQGMFQGVAWPSMHACISRWIPPIERPRFIAVVYFASTLSSAMTLPLCGVIIHHHGWAAAFYVTGALSILWCALWFSFMYNSPSEHPRISKEELSYIQVALHGSGTSEISQTASAKRAVPWKNIFTSLPMWAILAAALGNGWGISLFAAQLPTYMKNVLGFSIRSNGALSALPFLSRYIGGICWSSLGSWLLARNYLTIVNTRRIFSVIALWGPGAMVIGVTFAGCDWKSNVAMLCVALFLNGATTTSNLVNHTDIAPNYAGTLLGIDNTLGSIIAFVVPIITGVMTDGQQTLEAWKKVFWICGPMYLITEVFYLIFCSGDVQPWNNLEEKSSISMS